MNAYDARSGRASAELPGLFPFWLSRYAGTLARPSAFEPLSSYGEVAFEEFRRGLRAFCERQAARLLDIVDHCPDPTTQQRLIDIASEYVETLERLSGEKPILRPKTNIALIVPPRRPPQTRAPLTKIPEGRRTKAA
jgi:hypothetical protein